MSEDIVFQVKAKSGRLYKAMLAKFGTVAALARAADVPLAYVYNLIAMKTPPMNSEGDFTIRAYSVATALGKRPQDLWPGHMARITLDRNVSEMTMSLDDVVATIGDSERNVVMREAIARWSRQLTPRQVSVLTARVCGSTYEDIAGDLAGEGRVTRERVRQIEQRAMQKMRQAAARERVTSIAGVTQ